MSIFIEIKKAVMVLIELIFKEWQHMQKDVIVI